MMFLYICLKLFKYNQMPRIYFLILALAFGGLNAAFAQFGFSHEIGVIVGPVAMQSDYGERHDLSTNAGNTGFGIGLVHYLNFSYKAECNCYTPETYFNDHFKVRTELSYSKTNLQHFGKWVEDSRTSVTAEQLRNMRGSTAITNIGMQLEYFPLSIRDFTATTGSLAPFVSLGAQFSHYNPEASSTTGPLTVINTPIKYRDAFTNDSGTVWSVVASVGTRYKLNEMSDLMLDLRFQYYFSDWVDGLRPNPDRYSENKANDWLIWLNVGYIYYLN